MPEGNFGTPVMRFLVTLATAATRQTSVAFTTTNGTARAGEDYLATQGTLVFKAGEKARTVDVRVVGDARVESDETLTVTLSNPAGLTLGTATATGTIVNDDAAKPAASPATSRSVGSPAPQRTAVSGMPAFLAVAPQAASFGASTTSTASGRGWAGAATPATESGVVAAVAPPPPDRLSVSPAAVVAIAAATPPRPQPAPGRTAAAAPPSGGRLEAFAELAGRDGLFGS
jgi:hypothetical protein